MYRFVTPFIALPAIVASAALSSWNSSLAVGASVDLSLKSSAHLSLGARDACSGNTASNRSLWCDYDISTNYYDVVPDTGVTVEYWFELTNITASPDGYARNVLTVNGSFPGPTIEANWGDTVIVHVTNSLSNNGTSLHFHGIRQNYTNSMDGVNSITQCPVAPSHSVTYTWRATQYGSSWYHSHYSLQAWEGVFGGIVIHGPSTANFDTDLGMLVLNDWDHQTVDELYTSAETSGPPTLDTGVRNPFLADLRPRSSTNPYLPAAHQRHEYLRRRRLAFQHFSHRR